MTVQLCFLILYSYDCAQLISNYGQSSENSSAKHQVAYYLNLEVIAINRISYECLKVNL